MRLFQIHLYLGKSCNQRGKKANILSTQSPVQSIAHFVGVFAHFVCCLSKINRIIL